MIDPSRMLSWCTDPDRPVKKYVPGLGSLWIVHNPLHIETVLHQEEDSFSKGGELWAKLRDFLGERSLITIESPPSHDRKRSDWAKLRAEAMAVLDKVSSDVIMESAERVCQELHLTTLLGRGATEVDLRQVALSFTGRVMLDALNVPTEDHAEVLALTSEGMGMLTGQMLRGFLPFGSWLPSSRRFQAICKRLTELLGEKRDLVVTMLVAGRDTTASGIVSALREPTMLAQDAVAKWAPIYWFPRIARSAVLLGSNPADTIEPGDTVIIFPYGAYRLHGEGEYAYGWGVRRCAGRWLAQKMTLIFVARFQEIFDVEPIGENVAEGGITLWMKHRRAFLRLSNSVH